MDGAIKASNKGSLNNSNWAGALQIFTTTTEDCTISGNGELQASVFAPYAALKASGGGESDGIVGSFVAKSVVISGQMGFHYDEALRNLNTFGGNGWATASWTELGAGIDAATLSDMTGGFLP